MNPLVLLGLGAAAIIAAGGKKKSESKNNRSFSATPVKAMLPTVNIVKKIPSITVPDWSEKINQHGPKIAKYCRKVQKLNSVEDVARCVASDLFPTSGWPATKASQTWEISAWNQIINVTRAEFGLPAAPKPVQTQSIKIG